MANLKISQLSAGAPAVSTDLIPIDRAGANFSLQVSDVLAEGIVGGSGIPAPGIVHVTTVTGEASPTGAYATFYTPTVTGIYEVTGSIYMTTKSSTTGVLELIVAAVQNGSVESQIQSAVVISEANQGVPSIVSVSTNEVAVFSLAANTAIALGTFQASGTNTSGVWTYNVVVKRLA